MTTSPWMIYGANGYTGELAAREAVRRGLKPILAGRDGDAVGKLAKELGLESRSFSLDDWKITAGSLGGVSAVLHCAGPFMKTSAPMVRACIEARSHYLDITGEISVFESIMAQHARARDAGVVLAPGVGFDVVPTDCLASILAEELPDAIDLTLAFYSKGGTISRGTLTTMIESLPAAGAIRREGRIVPVPIAFHGRMIPFSIAERYAITIPWGDISTAWHTTGIPNIRVYSATPRRTAGRMQRFGSFVSIAAKWPVKPVLLAWARRRTGPDSEMRKTARMYLWGEVRNAEGSSVSATMDTPEAYAFTAMSAVVAAERISRGEVAPGSWTASRALGKDFAEKLPGVNLDPIVRVR